MRTTRKLFEATVTESELDPAYVFLRDYPDRYEEDTRRYLEDLWKEFQPLADPNFHDQLQRRGQFHARVWEMRLAVVLKRLGLPICARGTTAGPDIRIDTTPTTWIEAVAPAGTKEQWDLHHLARKAPVPFNEPEIILRYTQALHEKWRRRGDYLDAGIVDRSDAYLIAVTGSALPDASAPRKYGQHPSIASALYGIGPYRWEIEVGTGRILDAGYSHRAMITKASGAGVESDLFLSEKRAGISAVLYSPDKVQKRPTASGRVDGWDFLLFHNPFAAVPLGTSFLKVGQEWGVENDELKVVNDHRHPQVDFS